MAIFNATVIYYGVNAKHDYLKHNCPKFQLFIKKSCPPNFPCNCFMFIYNHTCFGKYDNKVSHTT